MLRGVLQPIGRLRNEIQNTNGWLHGKPSHSLRNSLRLALIMVYTVKSPRDPFDLMSWMGCVTIPFTPLHRAAPTACDPEAKPMGRQLQKSDCERNAAHCCD